MNPKRIAEMALANGLELTPQLLGFAHELVEGVEAAYRQQRVAPPKAARPVKGANFQQRAMEARPKKQNPGDSDAGK